jgi:hypothetical protein
MRVIKAFPFSSSESEKENLDRFSERAMLNIVPPSQGEPYLYGGGEVALIPRSLLGADARLEVVAYDKSELWCRT